MWEQGRRGDAGEMKRVEGREWTVEAEEGNF
jgi:hypothetical protein